MTGAHLANERWLFRFPRAVSQYRGQITVWFHTAVRQMRGHQHDVAVLKALRSGNTNEAISLLETKLDVL